jgi:hypothetical protein
MAQTFISKLQTIQTHAINDIERQVKKMGEESQFSSETILPIPRNVMFIPLEDGRILAEVGKGYIYDDIGNIYEYDVLSIESLCAIADYLNNI